MNSVNPTSNPEGGILFPVDSSFAVIRSLAIPLFLVRVQPVTGRTRQRVAFCNVCTS